MTKKYVSKNAAKPNLKDGQSTGQREKHFYPGLLFRGFSFVNHSHGRTNIHAIGFNHEPGTM